MNAKKCILFAVPGLAVAAMVASGISISTKTFRTTGIFIGMTQGKDQVTSNPQFDRVNFAGKNLVNLAMGRSAEDTNAPSQVMALTFACDLSQASLVVYDRSASNVVGDIAFSRNVDAVKQQDTNQTGPNRARFVAHFTINQTGSVSNSLLGGYLTVAGHVRLDPATGCPESVLLKLDRDSLDKLTGDKELSRKEDADTDKLTFRAGLAHLIGVVDAVNDGKTNTILVPFGRLSMRRELPVIPN